MADGRDQGYLRKVLVRLVLTFRGADGVGLGFSLGLALD
jgi:hypothetical protein